MKFEISLAKIFSLKQKNKSNTLDYIRKEQILSLQENSSGSSRQGTTMEKYKAKAI